MPRFHMICLFRENELVAEAPRPRPRCFFQEKDGLGSETGYERLALSQASAVSAVTGRTKRKCSLAINPIHQILPSKRLRVENGVQKKKPQGRE